MCPPWFCGFLRLRLEGNLRFAGYLSAFTQAGARNMIEKHFAAIPSRLAALRTANREYRLHEQRHDLEPVDVDQALVGDLEGRDDGQCEEGHCRKRIVQM